MALGLPDLALDYTLRTVALGAMLLGLSSGVVGTYAVLRRESLLGDAMSHAALPGIALAFLLTRSKESALLLAGAVAALENAIQAEVRTPQQREMVNRSLLFMGFMFYEEQSLSKAVTALRSVPESSYYYEDALLGLAWSAVRARQWQDCLSSAQTLTKTTQRPILRCEGQLLQAYAYLMRKEYSPALMVLSDAARSVARLSPPSEDSLEIRKQKYASDRLVNEGIGTSAYDLAFAAQSETVRRMIDSLYTRQVQTRSAIDDFLRYEDEFGRNGFFARNLTDLRADVEYALAAAEKISGESTNVRQTKDALEKGVEIDKEIQKIREEMERLDRERLEKEKK